jgi:hypothetical protein
VSLESPRGVSSGTAATGNPTSMTPSLMELEVALTDMLEKKDEREREAAEDKSSDKLPEPQIAAPKDMKEPQSSKSRLIDFPRAERTNPFNDFKSDDLGSSVFTTYFRPTCRQVSAKLSGLPLPRLIHPPLHPIHPLHPPTPPYTPLHPLHLSYTPQRPEPSQAPCPNLFDRLRLLSQVFTVPLLSPCELSFLFSSPRCQSMPRLRQLYFYDTCRLLVI